MTDFGRFTSADIERMSRAQEKAQTPVICTVEPIRGPSENAVTLLYELLEKAKNGEIRGLCVAWEEWDGFYTRVTKEPGGSLIGMVGALDLLKDDVKTECREARERR